MLRTILMVLLVLWLLGFALGNFGGLIHTLLVVAVIILCIDFFNGRRNLI